MVVLGVSGADRDAAAALAVDGRVVSAAMEESFARVPGVGYAQTGGFPHAAVDHCLRAAGLTLDEVTKVVVVEEPVRSRRASALRSREPVRSRRASALRSSPAGLKPRGYVRGRGYESLSAVHADALSAALSSPEARAVLVAGESGLSVFRCAGDGALGPAMEVEGSGSLAASARALADLLGLGGPFPYAALDDLSHGAEPIYLDAVASAFTWTNGAAAPAVSAVDDDALRSLAVRIAGEHAERLADAGSLNARVHDVRRGLAASFVARLAEMALHAVEWASEPAPPGAGGPALGGPVAAGGALFANPRFNTELAATGRGAGLRVAPVPGPAGRALGAAGGHVASLALGPAFDDEAVKRVLDNCRLDSLYEPDWARLIARVSRMLASGKIVAWVQGPMAFGARALGSRSILADPSQRYARQNINEYLRARPAGDPLPVALAPSQAAACLDDAASSMATRDVAVRADRRQSLAAALDLRHRVRVAGPSSEFEPRLCDLLEHHQGATGTPGLIELPLAAAGEPTACTPRDAVRTMFSSAIDAMVIGRFLLMKDYWLLRMDHG